MSQLISSLTDLLAQAGYGGIFVTMVLESIIVPIPSEIVVPFGGYLASQGRLSFWGVVFVAAFANLVGSLVGYALGARYGHQWLVRIPFVRAREVEHAERFLARYGLWAAFLGRLVPGVRTVVSIPIGVGRVPLVQFSLFTFIGSVIWCYLLATIGYHLQSGWEQISGPFRWVEVVVALLVLISVGWWLWRRRRPN